jgi:hypothetical protein
MEKGSSTLYLVHHRETADEKNKYFVWMWRLSDGRLISAKTNM